MNAPRQTSTRTAEPVLVEISADGFVRVYGSKNVSVQIINRPVASTRNAGLIVDELIEEALPKRFREIYFPGMVRRTGFFKRTTVVDLQQALVTGSVFAAVDGTTLDHRAGILSALGGSNR